MKLKLEIKHINNDFFAFASNLTNAVKWIETDPKYYVEELNAAQDRS